MRINTLVVFLSLSVPVVAWGDWSASDAPGATVSSGNNAALGEKNTSTAPQASGVTINQEASGQVDEKASALELALGLENSKSPTLGKNPEEKKAIIKRETSKKKIRQTRPNVAVDDELTFSSGSAELTSSAENSVSALAKVYAGNSQQIRNLVIDGHTDAQGDDASNVELSRARANAVKEKLIEKGVPAHVIKTNGYGEKNLLPGIPPSDGLNRRVEYSISK